MTNEGCSGEEYALNVFLVEGSVLREKNDMSNKIVIKSWKKKLPPIIVYRRPF